MAKRITVDLWRGSDNPQHASYTRQEIVLAYRGYDGETFSIRIPLKEAEDLKVRLGRAISSARSEIEEAADDLPKPKIITFFCGRCTAEYTGEYNGCPNCDKKKEE